jgi:hypothetical protein
VKTNPRGTIFIIQDSASHMRMNVVVVGPAVIHTAATARRYMYDTINVSKTMHDS